MKFSDSSKKFRQHLFEALNSAIPVESSKRSRLHTACSICFYALDYIVLMCMIVLPKTHYISPFESQEHIIFACILGFLSLLYIKIQSLYLLVAKKILWVICCFLTPPEFSIAFYALIPVYMLSWVVWFFTLERRRVHFDCRLHTIYPLIKAISLELALGFLYFTKYKQVGQREHGLFMVYVLFWLYLDYKETIYNVMFKNALLLADLCLLSTTFTDFINQPLLHDNFSTFQQSALLLINATCAVFILLTWKHEYQILYSVNPFTGKNSDIQILDYFMELDLLCEKGDQFQVVKYMVYHIHDCEDNGCFLRSYYSMRKSINITANQSLRRFLFETLSSFAQKNMFIRNYLIYRGFENTEVIAKLFDHNNFFHWRENQRMISQFTRVANECNAESKSVVLDIDKLIGDGITECMKRYMNHALDFWKELLEYQIDMTKLFTCASLQAKEYKTIRKFIQDKSLVSESKRLLVNEFMKYICKEEKDLMTCNLMATQKYISGTMEAPPTILVSAERENFMQIVQINTAVVKASGFTRKELLGLNIQHLWPEDLRQQHIKHIYKRSKENVFESGKVRRSFAFITNKFGYIVFVDGFVYYMNDIEGKKWCVVLEPYLSGEALFVTNWRREIVGINEYCTHSGMNKGMIGQVMNESIYKDAIEKKTSIKIRGGTTLLQEKTPGFDEPRDTITIKYITEARFNANVVFYAFTVNKKAGNVNKKSSYRARDSDSENNGLDRYSIVGKIDNLVTFSKAQPPAFQFNFDLKSACFTNYPAQLRQITIEEEPEQQKRVIDCDEIVEMRIFKGKIDFIENMPDTQASLHEFPRVPWAAEFKYHKPVSERVFKEVKTNRMKAVPREINLLRVFVLFSFLIFLGVIVFQSVASFLQNRYKDANRKLLQLSYQQFENLITLSTKSFALSFEPSANLTDIVMQKIANVEEVYQQLSDIQSSFSNRLKIIIGDQPLDTAINTFRLLLNDHLIDPSKGPQAILQIVQQKIYPGWTLVVNQLYFQIASNSDVRARMYIITLLASFVMIGVLVIVYWKLASHMQRKLKDMCIVFKNIPETLTEIYIKKLTSFKDYLDIGKCYIDEQTLEEFKLTYYNEDTQGMYRRKLTNSLSFLFSHVFFHLSILIIAVFLVKTGLEERRWRSVHANHISMIRNSYNLTLQAEMIWAGLNTFPYNVTMLDTYQDLMYESDRHLQENMNDGFSNRYYSDNLTDFFKVYTYQNACKLLVQPDCPYVINSALTKGIKQMFAYLFRKYDYSMHQNFQPEVFYSLSTSHNIYTLHTNYMGNISSIFSDQIQLEDTNFQSEFKVDLFINLVFLISCVIAGLFSYKFLKKVSEQVKQMEEFLCFLPFDYIQDNHKYWSIVMPDYKM